MLTIGQARSISLRVGFVALGLVLARCGGRTGAEGGGPSDSGSRVDAGIDSDRAGDGAAWTQCSAPSGVRVCRGPSTCPVSADDPQCQWGLDDAVSPNPNPGALCVCANGQTLGYGDICDGTCRDGAICVQTYSMWDTFFCAPYDLGVLFAQNGASSRVRYADMGAWNGGPIPAPDTCPDITGITLCGGLCTPCPAGTVCEGRSPLHPYGFCTPERTAGCKKSKPQCSNAGDACFIFTVEAAVQSDADQYGHCVPKQLCLTLAQSLPGGGTCVTH